MMPTLNVTGSSDSHPRFLSSSSPKSEFRVKRVSIEGNIGKKISVSQTRYCLFVTNLFYLFCVFI